MTKQVKRVHLGCGLTTPAGWINVDGSWNARLAKHPCLRRALHALRILPGEKFAVPWRSDILIHDVRKPLPFPDSSVGEIYSSHMLEHLYFEEAKRLLEECFRILQAGGVLRMVVPDLRAFITEYLGEKPVGDSSGERAPVTPADRLNERLLLRPAARGSGGLLGIYAALKDFHSHKWMYDADSLAAHFQRAGFAEVQAMPFQDSRIHGIEEVEQASRVLNGEGICVEGVKPGSESNKTFAGKP